MNIGNLDELLLALQLIEQRHGRALVAIRSDETAADEPELVLEVDISEWYPPMFSKWLGWRYRI